MYKENRANYIFFFMRNLTTGAGMTGLSPTGYVTKDIGAQGSVAGGFTETGRGQYRFNGAAEDFNGSILGFLFCAPGAVDYDVTVTTTEKTIDDMVGEAPVNVAHTSNIIHRS
jgi:hypothetical protein